MKNTIRVNRALVLHHAFGRDDVLLEAPGFFDPLDMSQKLTLGFKVAKGTGEEWVRIYFPDLPIETVNAFGEHTPVPFSSLERQQAGMRVEDLRKSLVDAGAEPGIHDSVIMRPTEPENRTLREGQQPDWQMSGRERSWNAPPPPAPDVDGEDPHESSEGRRLREALNLPARSTEVVVLAISAEDLRRNAETRPNDPVDDALLRSKVGEPSTGVGSEVRPCQWRNPFNEECGVPGSWRVWDGEKWRDGIVCQAHAEEAVEFFRRRSLL